jgi:hypothetical protein
VSVPVPYLDSRAVEQAAEPGAYVVLSCERAKAWLTHALERGDIDQIVELRSQAEAIRVYTLQRDLGKDAELAAAEIVRRAERGIGVAIRKGQESGVIRSVADTRIKHPAPDGDPDGTPGDGKRSPAEFFPGAKTRNETYAMTDGVSDDQFEEAIEEAKEEGNLSRANVVRKVKGQPAKQADRHEVLRKTRRPDARRIMAETIAGLEGTEIALRLIDPEGIEPEQRAAWARDLRRALRPLNTFVGRLSHE